MKTLNKRYKVLNCLPILILFKENKEFLLNSDERKYNEIVCAFNLYMKNFNA